MPQVRILTEADIRRALPFDLSAIDCISNALSALADGLAVMPRILAIPTSEPKGEIDVRTAWIPGATRFGIRVAAGLLDDPQAPTTAGQTLLFSAETGEIEAVLLDDGYLTEISAAAAGAVAARVLARQTAETVCLLGAGRQARLQLRALNIVRPIRSATIWDRDVDRARRAAVALGEELGLAVDAVLEPEEAVREADVIVASTPATQPVLRAEWLRPGQHVTAVGAGQPGRNEIEPGCLIVARYVPDLLAHAREAGELRAAIAAGVVAPDAEFDELGSIVAQKAPGRRTEDEVTIADLTGTGVQDTALAVLAHERAEASQWGTLFES